MSEAVLDGSSTQKDTVVVSDPRVTYVDAKYPATTYVIAINKTDRKQN